VTEIPCWVVNTADTGAQARVFVSVNRDRTNIQPLQLYRAQLAAKDTGALRIEAVCKEAGVTFAFHIPGSTRSLPPGQPQAVSTIHELLVRHGDGPVTMALKTLVAAYPDTPGQLRGQVIETVATMLAKYGERIDAEHLKEVLAERDCEEPVDAARRYKKLMGGSTIAGMMAALVKNYNRGRTGHRRLPAAEKR